jgi:two-component system, LytTR family, response regulator
MEFKDTDKIRTLIVDDETIPRDGIRMYLAGEKDVDIIGECANGFEAVEVILEASPDLVFLDVQMPGLDGFGVIETVGVERMPTTIFVTAYDKYALRAFDVHALDYLLKPFDKARLLKALGRSREAAGRGNNGEVHRQLLALIKDLRREQRAASQSHTPAPVYQDRFVIKAAGRIFFLNAEEIDWIEAADNYVRLHAGRESHLIRGTITGLESKLDPDKFLRIRRTIIINTGRVKEMHQLFNGEYTIIFHGGTQVRSSRRFRNKLSLLLGE